MEKTEFLFHLEETRKLLSSEEAPLCQAAAYVLKSPLASKRPSGKKVELTNESAIFVLQKLIQKLLEKRFYLETARLLWLPEVFTVEPASVKQVWESIPNTSELLIMGAGSVGKSYTLAVWFLLDWLRDPEWTCVKVISVTEEHAKRNVFAHIKNLFTNSRIPLIGGPPKDKSIQVNNDDKQGIHLLTIPQGDEGKGRLRGFHPVPRNAPHPVFGTLSRVRVLLDEAEEIPSGVWEDVDNNLITKYDVEHVKIAGATNPKDRDSKFGQRCEPIGGWDSVSIEESLSWKSRLGWDVVRIDGARCENVVQRKVVFPGLLTWEGYARYLAMGDTAPSYFTMARGWFPVQGLSIVVIPPDYFERSRGVFTFNGATVWCASVDLAFEGGDNAPMTIGRWGTVSSWTDPQGKRYEIEALKPDREGRPRSRYGLQIESQFMLKKTETLDMARQIQSTCKNLSIESMWLICDRTGNGTGVHDALRIWMGTDVFGLHYGEGASELKILEEDTETAAEQYDGVVTELFFAARHFMQFHFIKFGPSVKIDRLKPQLTTRRFKQAKGKLVRVESKKEYKARGNDSPDEADSVCQLIHLVRMRSPFTAQMLATSGKAGTRPLQTSPVDEHKYIDFNVSE